jgi:ABC-type glycerol-3-phosphate transport system substrate-binding protein
MKEKISPFQMILLVVLGFAILVGVLLFSSQRNSSNTQGVPVTMWGTVPQDTVQQLIDTILTANRNSISLTYVAFTPDEFDAAFVEALASGNGPDLVILDNNSIVKHENKLSLVSYDYYPQKVFKDTFIDAGNILLKSDGIVGFPFIIDPMVMYYNKSVLNSEGVASLPKYWNDFTNLVPNLTKKDSLFTISRSVLPFGEFRNVPKARDIFAMLVMQAGNPIIVRNTDATRDVYNDTSFISIFQDRLGLDLIPAEAALTFFTQFSNPSKVSYTWNRSLPNAEAMFLSGDLVFYFDYASQYAQLQRKNPNLNFDVALMPQSQRDMNEKITGGTLSFIGLVKSSPKLEAAFNTAYILTNYENVSILNTILNLPPVRRDLLGNTNNNAALQVFHESALITKPFMDPDQKQTQKIFTDMVESVVSGRLSGSEAVRRAHEEFSSYVK